MELQVDDEWYVKLPKSELLERVTIVHMTPLTVELRIDGVTRSVCKRYEKTDVKFVEKQEKLIRE